MNRFPSSGIIKLFTIAISMFIIAGCAPDIAATSVHESLSESSGPSVWLTVPVSPDLPSGYSVDNLRPDTHWRIIGDIPEGTVYKPADWTFKVRTGLNYYDCYIVVDRKHHMMQGIYIPAYSSFVSLTPPRSIYFNE